MSVTHLVENRKNHCKLLMIGKNEIILSEKVCLKTVDFVDVPIMILSCRGATTLSIMTFSIITLNMKEFFATFSIMTYSKMALGITSL